MAIQIDCEPESEIRDPSMPRPEGVAFAPDGRLLAVADARQNKVSVYARNAAGVYAGEPVSVLNGPATRLDYAHDLAFSPDGMSLAVANRRPGSITLYARSAAEDPSFDPWPVFEIRGWRSGLAYTDGVQFVPPAGGYLAAINREHSSVTFYRRRSQNPHRFGRRPCFQLSGPKTRIAHPDGLGFSRDGEFLAVTNHGRDSVTIYQRKSGSYRYAEEPIAEIESGLKCPHSVAFSPRGTHLTVSSAGGRTLNVYLREAGDVPAWKPEPAIALAACDPNGFETTNGQNGQEGGAKGVAFCADRLAICSAQIGLRVYRFAELGE